jgi:hypothetical protein
MIYKKKSQNLKRGKKKNPEKANNSCFNNNKQYIPAAKASKRGSKIGG